MTPKLYYNEICPPARSVLLTLKALDLQLDLISVNLAEKEHLTPEYLKMNPQHTVPTLVDNGLCLCDSQAINAYLVSKYGQDDSLYPRDLQKKAAVDQRLFFNASVVQSCMQSIVVPFYRDGATSISKDKEIAAHQTYDLLEAFLESSDYLAADNITIADLCTVAIISTIVELIPFTEKHIRLNAWLGRLKELPYYYETNQTGVEKMISFIRSQLA